MKTMCQWIVTQCLSFAFCCVVLGEGSNDVCRFCRDDTYDRDDMYNKARQMRAMEMLGKFSRVDSFSGMLPSQQRDELQKVADEVFSQYTSQYCGRLVSDASGKEVCILFETHRALGLWSLSVFDDRESCEEPYLVRFPFLAYYYKDILACGVTNCFGGRASDTFVVEFTCKASERDDTQKVRRLFFAVSRNDRPKAVRLEYHDGTPLFDLPVGPDLEGGNSVYKPHLYPPIEFFDTDERVLINSLQTNSVPEILNKFMILNMPSWVCKPENFKSVWLHKACIDVLELRSSSSFSDAVALLLKHQHPWVRQAANHYLVNYGTLGGAVEQPGQEKKKR